MQRSANGAVILRFGGKTMAAAAAAAAAATEATSGLETDPFGLPLVNCSLPAPWSMPHRKTYKQVSFPLRSIIVCLSVWYTHTHTHMRERVYVHLYHFHLLNTIS